MTLSLGTRVRLAIEPRIDFEKGIGTITYLGYDRTGKKVTEVGVTWDDDVMQDSLEYDPSDVKESQN